MCMKMTFTQREDKAKDLLAELAEISNNADYLSFKKSVANYIDACFNLDLVGRTMSRIMDAIEEDDDINDYVNSSYYYLDSEQELEHLKDVIKRTDSQFIKKVATEIDDYDGTYIVKVFFNRYLNVLEATCFDSAVFGIMAEELTTGEEII